MNRNDWIQAQIPTRNWQNLTGSSSLPSPKVWKMSVEDEMSVSARDTRCRLLLRLSDQLTLTHQDACALRSTAGFEPSARNPGECLWLTKNIWRYLDVKLWCSCSENETCVGLVASVDASFASESGVTIFHSRGWIASRLLVDPLGRYMFCDFRACAMFF